MRRPSAFGKRTGEGKKPVMDVGWKGVTSVHLEGHGGKKQGRPTSGDRQDQESSEGFQGTKGYRLAQKQVV